MRSAVILLSVVVGESVPRFDIVMALIGGSLTGSLVFILPPLIYSRMLTLKKSVQTTTIEEIPPGSRKRFNSEQQHLLDPKAHSRSTYYGFLSDTNNPRRYEDRYLNLKYLIFWILIYIACKFKKYLFFQKIS